MPRAPWLLSASLLVLASLAPHTIGAPLVPDVLVGSGTATTFQVFFTGVAVQGGAFHWSEVCSFCWIRMNVEGAFTVVDADGVGRSLDPGLYELREYRGFFGFSQRAPGDFAVLLAGVGQVERVG